MRTVWNKTWQEKHGMTGTDAFWAVEEAAAVIYTGTLYPLTSALSMTDFKTLVTDPLEKVGGLGEIIEDPDYLCFMMLVLVAMHAVHIHHPEATRVDIMIERSEKTTENLKAFHE